jgi:hypothetical protein
MHLLWSAQERQGSKQTEQEVPSVKEPLGQTDRHWLK